MRENYEPELAYLEQYLSQGQVFIDAGANTGIYTIVAGKLVGDSGLVLSFEPGVESFQTLERADQTGELLSLDAPKYGGNILAIPKK